MIKVSDYIADFFANVGIRTVFTVVGGGAMHLNDSFGHDERLRCIYNHHEQACSMAAEAYFRVKGEMAAVCVTSGPGAINALNGVVGAYQDSIPMIVVSGQVKTTLMARNSGLDLRTMGGQEFDIVPTLGNAAKYAVTVMQKDDIVYCLEKAFHTALSGRPGPCWLDIPVDVQGAMIDPKKIRHYNPEEEEYDDLSEVLPVVIEKLRNSKRPVLYAGNGIRWSGALPLLKNIVRSIGIPVVTCWDSIDLIETDDSCYAGRAGLMGDRAGNFTVQNSDLLLCIGNRLSIYQVGYDSNTWAREAFVIDVDIDENELKKPTIRVDLPVHADARAFLSKLLDGCKMEKFPDWGEWVEKCRQWKKRYPVVQKRHYEGAKDKVNIYAFMDKLSFMLPEDAVTVVANGSASVVGSHSYRIGHGQRFLMNCAISSMGYDLPAAIGACVANDKRKVICIAGDGSIQMNLQELQTIVTNRLPVKIFVINNGGYHQIRQTQNNIFHNGLVGVGPESGDLDFPDFERIAYAYRMPYIKIQDNSQLEEKIKTVLEEKSYYICEVICSTDQVFEPKSATKRLDDGSLYSPPLEDMAPFLPREELRENMLIDLVEE